ncbi:MAG: CsbD family protein [Candidatus Peribacteraceae bacterium]|nr:CsbD family protein [Candidatus Peribacteraceae bacterium]
MATMKDETMQTEGIWKRIAGRARTTWGDLTDDELERFKGRTQEFAGYLQQKTGQSLEYIREKLGIDESGKETDMDDDTSR